MTILFCYWVIPENIYTIPRAASWNSEGEGGVSWTGILKAWGGTPVWNSNRIGGEWVQLWAKVGAQVFPVR